MSGIGRCNRTRAEELILALDSEVKGGGCQEIEYARLCKDLERVHQRLSKGEYFYTDFAGNTFNVPERTREYFIYFNSYFKAARTWAAVLAGLDVGRFSSIVDVCPGWAPKIELALFYLGYRGTVVLLDKDAEAIRQNRSFIDLFHPAYDLREQVADVFDVKQAPGDLILANHMIDDLLLPLCAAEAGFDYTRIYEEEEAMRRAWRSVLSKREYYLSKIVVELSTLFSRLVKAGGCLVLTQYQAYVEKLLDLNEAADFCKEAALRIVKRLQSDGFRQDEHAAKCLEGAAGWFGPNECFVLQAP